ncbi:MAG TPA: helix-turn-helix transcriptional regulator [Bryobacteraceae bacterium]|nr:helix-turn-helix transcriptional regulator [Bryobacteraceae bacterium]
MYPNLKLQLWKTGIRQNRLAKMLGMDETILSKIVNGFREPSPQMREKIASLLSSDATWLFEPVNSTLRGDSDIPASIQPGAKIEKGSA